MAKNGKTFSVILIMCVSVLSLCMLAGCAEKAKKAVEWGDSPDFTLKQLDGTNFTLSSLKGKVILLDFWATLCGYCVDEIPDLIAMRKDLADKGFEVVGVSLDKRAETVKKFAEKNGINYILVMGDNKIGDKYNISRGIPTTFIIDKDGNSVKSFLGLTGRKEFEQVILELLEKGK